jgi:hypothetical protein
MIDISAKAAADGGDKPQPGQYQTTGHNNFATKRR